MPLRPVATARRERTHLPPPFPPRTFVSARNSSPYPSPPMASGRVFRGCLAPRLQPTACASSAVHADSTGGIAARCLPRSPQLSIAGLRGMRQRARMRARPANGDAALASALRVVRRGSPSTSSSMPVHRPRLCNPKVPGGGSSTSRNFDFNLWNPSNPRSREQVLSAASLRPDCARLPLPAPLIATSYQCPRRTSPGRHAAFCSFCFGRRRPPQLRLGALLPRRRSRDVSRTTASAFGQQ